MGIKLINELMDFAPPTSATEWKALQILAEDANDATRLTWSPVTGPKISRRVGLSPEAWTNLRGVLVRKGLLEVAEAGRRGRCAKYRFPDFRAMGHGSDEVTDPMGHETHDETDVQGHEIDDPSTTLGHESHEAKAEWVMGSVTPTPHSSSTTPQTTTTGARLDPAGPTLGDGGGGEGPDDVEPLPPNPAAAAVIDALPYTGRRPTRSERTDLIQLATAFLAAGYTDAELKTHLAFGLETARDRISVWRTRLAPDNWPTPGSLLDQAPGPATPKPRAAPARPPCATGSCSNCDHDECDRAGRITPEDDGPLTRCPCWYTAEARF